MSHTRSNSLFRSALVYGVPAGLITIVTMILGMELGNASTSSEAFGYLTMLVALSLIFVGTKRYRDHELGGVISFAKALLLGVSISVVAGVCYTLVWELYMAVTGNDVLEPYLQSLLKAKQAEGITGAELEAFMAKLDAMRAQYSQPLNRMFITFLEIFPVGFLVSLISAAIIRNSDFMPATRNN